MASEVYAICFNGEIERARIVATEKLARKVLDLKHRELESRAVQFHKESKDSFSYTFGWEEKGGTWHIVKLNIIDTEEELLHVMYDKR